MTSKPILSICIATFNREEFLDKQLNRIFKEISLIDEPGSIEVIVSNNASTDSTNEIVEKYKKMGLVYFEQSENVGPDKNFFTLFEMATGEYTWLLSDDDSINDDTIRYIVNTVSNTNIDYLYLRSSGDIRSDLGRGGDIYNSGEFYKRVCLYLTFISSQVIKSALIKNNIESSKYMFGNLMAYFHLYLKCLQDSKNCMISCSREVHAEPDNTRGYRFYQVWGKGVIDALKDTELGKDPSKVALFKNELLFKLLLPFTCSIRRSNLNSDLDCRAAKEYMDVHFGRGWRQIVFSAYTNSPLMVLKLYNLVLRGLNKFRNFKNNSV